MGEDRVIELSHAVAARETLMREGGDVTLDIVDDLGHAIDDRSMQFALDHLRYTVPKHYFDEALSGGKPNDDDIVEFMWCPPLFRERGNRAITSSGPSSASRLHRPTCR